MGREGEEEVYCVCRGPDDGSLMVECNYCSEWFHIGCIGVGPEDLRGLSEYKCAACCARSSAPAEVPGRRAPPPRDPAPRRAPHKRKGSPADAQDEGGETAQVRAKVVDGLAQALRAFHPDTDQRGLPAAIEEALFEAFREPRPRTEALHCGPAYKAKYRSLLFNLKEPKNNRLRARLLAPSDAEERLTPRQLVHLRPEEMANDDLSRFITRIREESMEQAVLAETEKDGFIKKTHKGEEVMSIFGPAPPADGVLEAVKPVLLDPIEEPLAVAESASSSTSNSALSSAPSNTPSSVPSSAPSNTPSNTSPTSLAQGRQIWFGRVLLQDVANFEAVASEIDGKQTASFPNHLADALPANFHITGRLPPARALAYLRSMRDQGMRDIFALRLDPASLLDPSATTPASTGGHLLPGRFIKYLAGADRWAVVSHDTSTPSPIRDFYIVPCAELIRHQEALEALQLMPEPVLAELLFGADTQHSFLALLVVSKQSAGTGTVGGSAYY